MNQHRTGPKVGVTAPILIVDDNIEFARNLEQVIMNWGVENPIHFFVDGSIVMQYLTVCMTVGSWMQPLPCLILLDINLPGISGAQVLQWMRDSKLDHIPVLAMTGEDRAWGTTRMLKMVNSYIQKPPTAEDFDKIKKALGIEVAQAAA